jgi:uncharacterized protein Yka (UPF0111/DUF47 family)
MATKAAIVSALGQKELLLPDLVHDALAANGRTKYFFTLLQLARQHADALDARVPDLRTDREVAGIANAELDAVVGDSRHGRDDDYRVPMAKRIVEHIFSDIGAMIVPLRAAGPERCDEWSTAAYERRLSALREPCLPRQEGTIASEAITKLTSSDRGRGDSAHLLVFDLHKAVDALAASLATDDVEGAKAYGLSAGDRPLVAAFMRGVHETEAVKFAHPGLGTTATRSGPKLILENDIGETSAHVLVVQIDGLRVAVTSTDIHVQRLEFFERLLHAFPISWSDMRSRSARELPDVGLFYECIGTFEAHDTQELERFLTYLGSRLVFLIDWNRARKGLREFIPKKASLELLDWAATSGIGHRGLLEIGGAAVIFDAMASVMRTPLRFGERLDDVLGEEEATLFLRFALRSSSEGLLQGRSQSLILAEMRAELARAFRAGGERLLGPIAQHAEIVAEMANALRGELRAAVAVTERGFDPRGAAHEAKEQERRADGVVRLLHAAAARMPEAVDFGRIIAHADDAADALEEAVFLLSLLPRDPPRAFRNAPLAQLGDVLVKTTEAYLEGVRSARRISVNRMLDAVDAILALEHRMDDAERHVARWVVNEPTVDGKLFVLTTRVAAQIEQAVDALTRAALLLRERTTLGGP